MQSFRVHCVHQTAFGRFPFLTLTRVSDGTVELDFSCMGSDRLPRVRCSTAVLADLLEGRCVDVSAENAYLSLTPLEDRVLCEFVSGPESVRQFLWKAELALAFNLLTPAVRFKLI